jgi:hypothetical protein
MTGIYFEYLSAAAFSFQGLGAPEMGDGAPDFGSDGCSLLPGFRRIFRTPVSPGIIKGRPLMI